MHVRHRRVRAHEHRRRPHPEQHGLVTTRRVAHRRQDDLRARGERVHRGGRGAVAARRARHHQDCAQEVEALARKVPSSDGVVFVPALAGLGAPHWDRTRAGTITGLTRGTTAAHIARATLEGIAFAGGRPPVGDAERRGAALCDAPRRRRGRRERPPDAVPGRHRGRRRRAADGARVDRTRRGDARGGRRRAVRPLERGARSMLRVERHVSPPEMAEGSAAAHLATLGGRGRASEEPEPERELRWSAAVRRAPRTQRL